METTFDQTVVKIESLERELVYWKEVLQKAEKYERLMADPDFLAVLEDLDQTVLAHEEEIKKCLDGMSEYSPKMLEDANQTLFVHQILKEQAASAIKRPKDIVELAKESRKKIPLIQDQIAKAKEEVHG